MAADMIRKVCRLTDCREKPQQQIFIEEDFLVPDSKPDVERIVCADGRARLGEKEQAGGVLRVKGEISLDILYVPSSSGEDPAPLERMEVRTPFHHEEALEEEQTGQLFLSVSLAQLTCSLINERKLRVKAILALSAREYLSCEKTLFEGFQDEPLELLTKTVTYTDLDQQKQDLIQVKEEAAIREGMPEIGKILKYDGWAGETYRQLSSDKLILNGALYYHILYLSDEAQPAPVFFQGRVDFTQFIRLEPAQEIKQADVWMRVEDIRIVPRQDGDENMTLFEITADIATTVDTYCERTALLTLDAYHSQKALDLKYDQLVWSHRTGSAKTELTVRETVNIAPSGGEPLDQIVYLSADALGTGCEIGAEGSIMEGLLEFQVIYRCGEKEGLMNQGETGAPVIRSYRGEIPFRGMTELSGLTEEMEMQADFFVKEIGCEIVSDHQIELYARIDLNVSARERETQRFICSADVFEDLPVADENETRVVLYVVKEGEGVWDIGKRYRTPAAQIRAANALEPEEEPAAGSWLLLWC